MLCCGGDAGAKAYHYIESASVKHARGRPSSRQISDIALGGAFSNDARRKAICFCSGRFISDAAEIYASMPTKAAKCDVKAWPLPQPTGAAVC